MPKKNIFYRLYRKLKKLAAKKIFGNKFFYKYFPRIFLWANFDAATNPNTPVYWNEQHRKEETGTPSRRFDNFVLSFLDRIDFRAKDVLDVGCGRGIFLSQLQNARSLTGVDISEAAVKIAGEKGIKAFTRTLPDLNLEGSFDIITCFETLEHTATWKKSILEMINLLNPDGFLIISVPFENAILTNEHVAYFDVPRLYDFLRQRLAIMEIKFLGPWLLMVAQNKKYQISDRPEYFFKKII